MKLDEDYKKVMNELQKNFGWSNIDVLSESYQDLLNDTIMAVKNLTIQNVNGNAFDATGLWNKALRLSVLETNGYWKALRDLEKIGVIKLADMTVD